jgi:3-oxoacyl-[acyl-carrier protein] reductase
MKKTLENKTVIVTGGSRGIGKATVLKLASMGAKIAFTYNSNEESSKKVVKESGIKDIAYFKCDVSKPEECKNLIKEVIKKFGSIDILVNNAGIYIPMPFLKVKEKDFYDQFNTNVLGLIVLSQEVIKSFGKNGGNIINLSSIVATSPFPNISIYSATKAVVDNLTITMAREFAGKNIRVNAIAPGGVDTDMGRTTDPKVRDQVNAATPLAPRPGTPEEIANVIAFLASNESYWINGKVITVDGGFNLE